MKTVSIDHKRILDFSPQYIERQISSIKRSFRDACKADKTLSKEYKEHISDLDNIKVDFRPVYGYDMQASFSSISAKCTFDYDFTYSSDSHVSGEVKFTSDGKADVSGLRTVKEYTTSTTQGEWNAYFSATATQECHMRFGQANSSNIAIKNYIDVTNEPVSSLSKALAQFVSKPITYAEINPFMKSSNLPSDVYESMRYDIYKYHKSQNFRNFSMSIYDYSIDELSVTYLPYTYEFDVFTSFDGKTYKQTGLRELADIVSKGPESNHYKEYLEEVDKKRGLYVTVTEPVTKKFYGISAIISAIGALGVILLLIFAKAIDCEAIRHYYLWVCIAAIAIFIGLGITSICCMSKDRTLHVPKSTYNPSKSIKTLSSDLSELLEKERKTTVSNSRSYFIFICIVTVGIAIGSGVICATSHNEHFWYTPELINSYTGIDEDDGILHKITVLSCDNDGKVEVTIEKAWKHHYYYKVNYTGEITKKTGSKTEVLLNIDSSKDLSKIFSSVETITFKNDFSEIDDYYGINMNVNNAVLVDDLNTPEITNTYVYYDDGEAHIIDILSCDKDGKLSAMYTYAEDEGYAKREITGEILAKTNSGELYAKLILGNYTEKNKDIKIGETEWVYISENCTKLLLMDYDYSDLNDIEYITNNTNVHFISTAEDFASIDSKHGLFILKNDIDFGDNTISSIKTLEGSIVGNGYTLKNFTVNSSSSKKYAGLIEEIVHKAGYSYFIYDLKIENGTVSVDGEGTYAGILCGICYGSIYDVSVSGKINASGFKYVGGIAGYVSANCGQITSTAEVNGGETTSSTVAYSKK